LRRRGRIRTRCFGTPSRRRGCWRCSRR
jgi:hypothetical protein